MAAPSEEMAKLALKADAVPPAPILAKGKKGRPTKTVTNSYEVTLKRNLPFFMHDFRVNAVFVNAKGEEKLKEVTKQTRDDYTEQVRKQASLRAYVTMKKTDALKGDFLYDRAALLVALQEIPQCKGGAEYTTKLTKKTAPQLFELESIKEAKEVRVTIKKAADTYQVSTNDVTSKEKATVDALRSIVNIATSQQLFHLVDIFQVFKDGVAYLRDPASFGFSAFDVGVQDKTGAVGLTKGARFIEKPGVGPAFAVTVDVKKTPMHRDWQIISDKMRDAGCADDPIEATRLLEGVKAVVWYRGVPEDKQKARIITIGSVTSKRVKDVTLKLKNGSTKSLSQYIMETYQTKINNPNSFVVVEQDEGNSYAPECLKCAPNQRVQSNNTPAIVIDKIVREGASLPAKRQSETATLARAMDAGADNKEQEKRGVTVNTAAPITVEARILDPVKLGTGGAAPLSVSGPWRQGSIAQKPLEATIKKWSVVHLRTGREREDLAHTTTEQIIKYAGQIGFPMGNIPLNIVAVPYQQRDADAQLESIIASEKEGGSNYIVVIAAINVKNHDILKYLEVKYDVVTQQITSRVAEDLHHKSNTGSNVVIKVVEKLGGQNHYISKTTTDLPAWITAKGTMICGLQMQHPSSLTGKEKEENKLPSRPVMVGWSVNAVKGATRGAGDSQVEKENTHFSAGWNFAMPKDVSGGAQYEADYQEVVLSMLRTFKKHRETVPGRILLYRGGIAEGDYYKIRSEEVAIWKAAFRKLNAAYNPTFIIMTVNTAHSDRFYLEKIPVNERAPKQNLQSGTVIDSVVTNPGQSQFFLQSHTPLQGTAKVPSVVVQYSNVNPTQKFEITMDDAIRTTHVLAYSHGICNSPTAVPTPLYVARESMERATNLFSYWNRKNGGRGQWDLTDLRANLTPNADTSEIAGLRVNA